MDIGEPQEVIEVRPEPMVPYEGEEVHEPHPQPAPQPAEEQPEPTPETEPAGVP